MLQKYKQVVIKACIGCAVANSPDATQVKMSRPANTTNMIMKSEILVKNNT